MGSSPATAHNVWRIFGMLRDPQARFLPLSAFVVIVFWGCAGLPPTPQRDQVMLQTNSSTQYYSVRGTTTGAIFDDIERNGLFDTKARRAVGLTSGKWGIDWKSVETRLGTCRLESMTITLNLVVTLPRHDLPNDLSQDIRTNWQRFAASVAAHEQRHVDIYLSGAKTMKARMEAILTTSSSCSELERVVRGIWTSQQAETERVQDEFHIEDEAKTENDRKPLQVQIDANRRRLTAINSELQGIDQTLDNLKRQRNTTQARIDAVKAEMTKSGISLPRCSQSPLTTSIQALCQQYNALAATYNALTDEYNGTASRRKNLADEHHRVVVVTNDLIEAYNWTP